MMNPSLNIKPVIHDDCLIPGDIEDHRDRRDSNDRFEVKTFGRIRDNRAGCPDFITVLSPPDSMKTVDTKHFRGCPVVTCVRKVSAASHCAA